MKKPLSKVAEAKTATMQDAVGTRDDASRPQGWYLESKVPDSATVNRVGVDKFPFLLGRAATADLSLGSRSVSSQHAEIVWDERTCELRVRDLGSTNGTFINAQRVESGLLVEGDILHVADLEFRVGRDRPTADTNESTAGARQTARLNSQRALPAGFVRGAKKLLELIDRQAFVPLFQSIVSIADRSILGYEALTRGRHPDLPQSPEELFRIAAELKLESELSTTFRRKAICVIAARPGTQMVFLNTHPAEAIPDLVKSAIELRRLAPALELVFEVHERTLVDAKAVRTLKTALAAHEVKLAFDDFGAGQARLLEFAEVPPDFLKFDIGFIRGIDTAPESKRLVLASLVGAARDLGVVTIAEGIETEGEAQACIAVGFSHAQGYLFGRADEASEL